jgi:hypothetical protein
MAIAAREVVVTRIQYLLKGEIFVWLRIEGRGR